MDRNGSDYGHDPGGPKVAFALCAVGERFSRYRDNLAASLRRYVPSADILDIDVDKAESLLPAVSDKRRSIQMSRVAIPLMDEFRAYDRVIWLDVDTDVVSGQFAGILSVETSPDGLAAAEDMFQDMYRKRMEERYPGYSKETYFNSGVIVMDLRKIDKDAWRGRVKGAIEEHARNPFKSPDQDILNRYFDVAPIDKRYNWIHRRGVDPDSPAWLVHYTDREGHKMLDEIISERRGEKNASAPARYVAVAPRSRFIRPWIRSYFANGNTDPLAIVRGNGPWSEEDEAFCSAAATFSGGAVVGCEGAFSDVAAVRSVAASLHPSSWAYLDDRTAVAGDLDECFAYAEKSPGLALVQFLHPSSIDNRHPERTESGRLCKPSPVFFHGPASERLLADLEPDETDLSAALGRLYGQEGPWRNGFLDFSIRRWTAEASLFDKDLSVSCKAIRYVEKAADEWASSVRLPPAPFEKGAESPESPDDGAIDAVFVIGTGSVDNNEELRYALRNLENRCPFVRNVYISGFCPKWVDRTKVIHLNWPDRFSHAKDANIIDKLRHACEHRGIARRILFCSDDQFQTRTCSWEDFRPRYLRRYASNDRWYADKHRVWHTRLRKTLEREVQRRREAGLDANEVFYYQPHIWMPIDRDRFIDYARWSRYETRDDTIIASGYFNFVGADGLPDFDHAFLQAGKTSVPKETHVAYHDGSEKDAMRILKAMFPERSRFELSDKPDDIHVPKRTLKPDRPRGDSVDVEGIDPAPATPEELAEITEVSRKIAEDPSWGSLRHEVSRAEEMRLFGVKGWRIVWNDIIARWKRSSGEAEEPRSKEAAKAVSAYLSDPDGMRTVRFGSSVQAPARQVPSFGRKLPRPASAPAMSSLRDRMRASLRDRLK